MQTTRASQPAWPLRLERVWVLGFWGFLTTLQIIQLIADPFSRMGNVGPGVMAKVVENTIWTLVTLGIFPLMLRRPITFKQTESGTWLIYVVLGVLITFAMEQLNFWTFRLMLRDSEFPFLNNPSTRDLPLGFLLPHFRIWIGKFVLYVGILGVASARNNLVRLRERERESLRLTAEAADLRVQLTVARLSALRMQLNPHFLFNTLHTISSLADDDPEGVQRIVARLSGLLRRALDGSFQQEIPLSAELSFVRDYLEIQQVRFQGKLEVTEEIEIDAFEALVPNLILQPLVENVIKHATVEDSQDPTRIVIGARRDEAANRLVLTVKDNGPGLLTVPGSGESQVSHVGLANIRERLRTLYDGDASLHLLNHETGGLIATITLPFQASPASQPTRDAQ